MANHCLWKLEKTHEYEKKNHSCFVAVCYKPFLFCTGNNLGRQGQDSIVNANNLTEIFNSYRPHYFNMDTHGNDTTWILDDSDFSIIKISDLENDGSPSIITTSACHTADICNSYPCLGEAFIQHPKGGALTYLGSSRYGFTRGVESQSMGASMNMCTSFWEKLISYPNYGEAIKEAKRKFLAFADNSNYAYNWLLKSMNALGDCEVPIYTKRPEELSDVVVYVDYDRVVFVAEDSVCFAFASKGDNGEAYYVGKDREKSSYLDENTTPRSICLTLKNYIPFYTETGRFVRNNNMYTVLLQNLTYKSNIVSYESFSFDNIYVGNNVDNTVESGDVVIEDGGTVTFMADHRTVIQSGFRCKTGGRLEIK